MPLQSRRFVPVTGLNGEGYLFQTSFIVKSTLCQAIQIKLACHLPPSPDGQGADDVTLYASILAWIRTDVEYNEWLAIQTCNTWRNPRKHPDAWGRVNELISKLAAEGPGIASSTIGHVVMQRPCAIQNSKIMMDQHIPLTHSAPKNYSLCSRIHWFRITQKNRNLSKSWSKMRLRKWGMMKSTFSDPKIFMISLLPWNYFWIGYYNMFSGSLMSILRAWEACNDVVAMNLILRGWERDMHLESPTVIPVIYWDATA